MIEAVVAVALRAVLASVVLGGVLALCVLAATRTLALTASTRHALWTTALIAMGVMPLAGIGISVWKGAAPQAARPPHVVRGPQTELARNIVVRHDGSALAPSPQHGTANAANVTSRDAATIRTTTAAAAPSTGTSSPAASSSFWLTDGLAFARDAVAGWTPRLSHALALDALVVWGIGALIGLLGLVGSLVRVHGLKRRSSPLDGELADELPWLTEIGPGREIYLRLSYETETPVAIGFRRPVILIPTELATADGLAAIEPLVLHEYAHLRRYDDWTNLLQRAIERIFWFNPVVWAVGRRIALEREIASDDAVVEKTGAPHAYATSLWKLAREMRMPEHAVVAPGALLTRKQISIRIEQLLDKNRSHLHRSPAAAFGVTCAALLAVAVVATSAPAVELPEAAAPVVSMEGAHASPVTAHIKPAVHMNIAVTRTNAAPVDAKSPQAYAKASAEYAKTTIAYTKSSAAYTKSSATYTKSSAGYTKSSAAYAKPAAPPGVPAVPADAVPPPHPMPPLPEPSNLSTTKRIIVPVPPGAPMPPHVPGLAGLGPEISGEVARAVHDAMAAIPAQIAQEQSGTPGRRTRFDGVKLSRDLVASCTGCSFRNADLRALDLHDLRISANDFSGADMRGANLSGAKLTGVSLVRANLANADLRNAQLSGVELTHASFDGAQLEGIKLVGVSLQHVSLRGTMLRSVIANCTGCDFNRLDLHGQDLHGITLSGADLSHADLHDANLSGVRFSGVDLSRANLSGADLTNARLDGCDLSGVDFRGARTTGMTMHGSGFDG
jgi:uncharacterized protein YjbI with pentapeptide repeats/beta-lactamase regulating signal transducer with metallopeptidase domain